MSALQRDRRKGTSLSELRQTALCEPLYVFVRRKVRGRYDNANVCDEAILTDLTYIQCAVSGRLHIAMIVSKFISGNRSALQLFCRQQNFPRRTSNIIGQHAVSLAVYRLCLYTMLIV